MTKPNISLAVSTPRTKRTETREFREAATVPAPYEPPPRDVLKEALQRSVAAKVVSLLPPDDVSARRILALAGRLYDEFASLEVCNTEMTTSPAGSAA